MKEYEGSSSRPKLVSGRTTFAAAGQVPGVHAATNYAAFFQNYILMKNGQYVECSNAAGDNRIIGIGAGSSDTLIVSGYDRKTATYKNVEIGGGGSVMPITNGSTDLGSATRRWDTVYAAAGTINTSDRSEKQQIEELTEAELRVAEKIKSQIRKFKYNDAVAKKGDDARIHIGVIAQNVHDAFVFEGLDPGKYSMFCKDEIYLAADGVAHNKAGPGRVKSERLGIRYTDLIIFILCSVGGKCD